ncbi:MAG: hypothetical protein JSS02_28240 [Planctomycetes bacterium]|nr:hypothetical protein [Planctomycetota bacterium]
MPARIIAVTPAGNISPVTLLECWIEAEVIRIGSDPAAEVQLPEVEPHLAAVQYRAGQYYLYRRSRRALSLGGQPVPPNTPIPWTPGHVLDIAGATSLTLTVESDPAPAPRPILILPEDGEHATQISPATRWLNRVRTLLLSVPILGMAYYLGASSSPAEIPQSRFQRIKHELNQPDPQRPRLASWQQRLQEARLQEIGGRPGAAYQTYTRLRDSLAAAHYTGNPDLSDTERHVLEFVGTELERLRGKRLTGL